MSKSDFEYSCLGGGFSKKITPNLTPETIQMFDKVITKTLNKFFFPNASLFFSIGLGFEDLKSICNCYLSSFMSDNSVMVEGDKRNKFIEEYLENMGYEIEPDDTDFFLKDQAVFTLFLRQRLVSFLRMAKKKRKDLTGYFSKVVIYSVTGVPNTTMAQQIHWLSTKEKQQNGFFRINGTIPRKMKNIIKNTNDNDFFEFNGKLYFKQRHTSTNKRLLDETVPDTCFDDLKNRFESLPEKNRLRLINKFIKNNANKKTKAEQLAIALELQKQLEGSNA